MSVDEYTSLRYTAIQVCDIAAVMESLGIPKAEYQPVFNLQSDVIKLIGDAYHYATVNITYIGITEVEFALAVATAAHEREATAIVRPPLRSAVYNHVACTLHALDVTAWHIEERTNATVKVVVYDETDLSVIEHALRPDWPLSLELEVCYGQPK